jgi:hypothetical protein
MPLATAKAVSLKIQVVYITNFYHLTLERCSQLKGNMMILSQIHNEYEIQKSFL